MPDYLLIKYVHVLSAIVLFGVGLGSVFYKFMTDRSGLPAAIALTNRLVVRADTWFTTPAILVQPLTGLYLVAEGGYGWQQDWLRYSILLYVIAGLCWLPVLVLQIRMRDVATSAAASGADLPPGYWRDVRRWWLLGVPAFAAMLVTVWLMVARPA